MNVPVSQIASALCIVIVLLAMLSIVYRSWRNGISPMPTSAVVRRAVAAELRRLTAEKERAADTAAALQATPGPGSIAQAGTIVDAGSGWGTLALDLAKQNPRWRVTGIENSLIPWAVSRLAAGLGFCRNVSFRRGDLYRYPYEAADMVVCYLYPGAMKRLDPILRGRLAAGARVISICFALPGWQADKVVTCRDVYRTKIYVYKLD